MIIDNLREIFDKVQQNASCHQKYLRVLKNYYNKTPLDEFCKNFTKLLKRVIMVDNTIRSPYVERIIDFCSKFVTEISKQNQSEEFESLEDSQQLSYPFLSRIIEFTLVYHDKDLVQARYHSCKFIMLILQNLGNDIFLDNDICDAIQEAMLERILDPKPNIRLQAITALVRLQDPINPECPVIKAYMNCFTDFSPVVRKEVVKVIGPNALTIPKIIERIRDVDFSVRLSAFGRCADIGPKLVKIVDRQSILRSGFLETNKLVKQVFLENLMPKWLTAYNGDFLQFLSGVKFDATETDLETATVLSKEVMGVFFRSNPIKDIISVLPIGEDKLIPFEKLTSEVVIYWSIITNYLRSSEDTEEYINEILPELTPFSNYIESIMKHKSIITMADWEYIDYQHILLNLFNIAEKYDFSDEVGRITLRNLIISTLQNQRCSIKLYDKIIGIAYQLTSSADIFANEMCQIISDIREPMVAEQPIQQKSYTDNFNVAGLKVKINILTQDKEDAIEKNEFEKAGLIDKQLTELLKKLEELSKPVETEKVHIVKDDTETTCRCLDILISTLQLKNISIMYDSLRTCKDEFVMPLISNTICEIYWRVLKCLVLFCLLDKETAEENAKFVCISIATYRTIPNINKNALIVSVEAISDLIRVYSADLFGSEVSLNRTNQSKSRKLYRSDDLEDATIIHQNKMTVEFIIEIILDMLDDENEEIRNTSIVGVAKLIMDSFTVSPFLISRMILKWYSPLTGSSEQISRTCKQRKENDKQDMKLQQKLGVLLESYAETVKGAKEIIEKAVIPTLTSIADAPRSSPLADIDVDNMLRFLAVIINTNNQPGIVNVHTNLAHSLCYKIANKPHDSCVPYLSKMLTYLDVPVEDKTVVKELISEADLLLQDVVDKAPRRNITKFMKTLEQMLDISEMDLSTINEGSQEQVNTSIRNNIIVHNNITINKEKEIESSNSEEVHISDVSLPRVVNCTDKNKTDENSIGIVSNSSESPKNDVEQIQNKTCKETNLTSKENRINSELVERDSADEEHISQKNLEIRDKTSKVAVKKLKLEQPLQTTRSQKQLQLRSNKNTRSQDVPNMIQKKKSNNKESKKPVEISEMLNQCSNADNNNKKGRPAEIEKSKQFKQNKTTVDLETNKPQPRDISNERLSRLSTRNSLNFNKNKSTVRDNDTNKERLEEVQKKEQIQPKTVISETDTDESQSTSHKKSFRLVTRNSLNSNKNKSTDSDNNTNKDRPAKVQNSKQRELQYKTKQSKQNKKVADPETDESQSSSNERSARLITRNSLNTKKNNSTDSDTSSRVNTRTQNNKKRKKIIENEGKNIKQNIDTDSQTETDQRTRNERLQRLSTRHSFNVSSRGKNTKQNEKETETQSETETDDSQSTRSKSSRNKNKIENARNKNVRSVSETDSSQVISSSETDKRSGSNTKRVSKERCSYLVDTNLNESTSSDNNIQTRSRRSEETNSKTKTAEKKTSNKNLKETKSTDSSSNSDEIRNNVNKVNSKPSNDNKQTRSKNKDIKDSQRNTDNDSEVSQKSSNKSVKVNKKAHKKDSDTENKNSNNNKRALLRVPGATPDNKRKKLVEPNVILDNQITTSQKQSTRSLRVNNLIKLKTPKIFNKNTTKVLKENSQDIRDISKNISTLTNPIAESTRYRTRHSFPILEEDSLNISSSSVSEQVKRKKQRGSSSKNSTLSEETILRTIIEPSDSEMSFLETSTFRTPIKSTRSLNSSSSRQSHRSRVVVTETSSDSDASTPRKSSRKVKKKEFKDYV